MEIFAIVLFLSGLFIFLSHLFNIIKGCIPVGSLIIMVISLGMLFNIISKKKDAEKEKLAERIQELETEIGKGNK